METIKKETPPESKVSKEIITQEKGIVNFNIENLISQAVVAGTSVEGLERLLAMRKDLKTEWAKEEFDKAMAKFQSEIKTIEKRKKVSFNTTNYSYAPLEDIVEQVKDALGRNGLSYSFDTVEADKAIKVICYAKHIAGHTEPSSLTIEIDSTSKMNKTQQYGSANSYGKRYAFCNAFGILTGDEDNDAQDFKHEMPAYPANQAPKHSTIPASKAQLDLIGKVMKEKGVTREDIIDAGFVGDSRKLTGGKEGTASELIEWLFKYKGRVGQDLPIIEYEAPSNTAKILEEENIGANL